MKTEHNVSEPVRSYLLGQLGDPEAAALEEKYFVDRSFFLRVQSVEQALIEDYLDNRLPLSERVQFESRYLKIPALQQKLEEVRSDRARIVLAQKPAFGWGWSAAFAVCLIGAIGAGVWVYVRQHRARSAAVTAIKRLPEITSPQHAAGQAVKAPADNGKQPPVVAKARPVYEGNPGRAVGGTLVKPHATEAAVPPVADKAEHPDAREILTVYLNPWQGMLGYAPGVVGFQLPPAGGPIRFVVELTGITSTVSCTPEIWILGRDPSSNKIWSSAETVASSAAHGGQELTVTVDSSLFHETGRYELRLAEADVSISSHYRFFVTGPR